MTYTLTITDEKAEVVAMAIATSDADLVEKIREIAVEFEEEERP